MDCDPNEPQINPYESPIAESQPAPKPDGTSIRAAWLATASLILAIYIVPTEADVLVVEVRFGRLDMALVAKAIRSGIIILAPLVLYFALNSSNAWRAAKGKIIAVAVIVILKMAMDVSLFVSVATRGSGPVG